MAAGGDTIEESVRGWLARHALPGPGEPLVVGCSGGPDSTALLLALAAALPGARLDAVYVDHGLRPGTDEEAREVAALAAGLGAGFAAVAVEVARTGNRLAAAREARYAALAAQARARSARCVAVGHTATDQAETVAFRAARGDLGHALAGMPEVRPLDGDRLLLRPLLGVRRDQTIAYVHARGITPVADPTNERLDFARTRIRRALAAAAPAAEAALLQVARTVAGRVAEADVLAAALGPPDGLSAAAVAAAGPAVALRLLRRAGLHRAGGAHVRALIALASSSAGSRQLDLGGGLVAERRYDRLRIGAARTGGSARTSGPGAPADPAEPTVVPFAGPGVYRLPGRVVEVSARAAEGACAAGFATVTPAADATALDPRRLPDGLVLRTPRPGDRLRARAGGRKLHDMLIDRKVPRAERAGLAVLAAASEVVWVEGLGAAHGLAADPRGPRLDHHLPLVPVGERAAGPAPGRLTRLRPVQ